MGLAEYFCCPFRWPIFQIWPYPRPRSNHTAVGCGSGFGVASRTHGSTCVAPWHHVRCP
jgi:hypothetical protein